MRGTESSPLPPPRPKSPPDLHGKRRELAKLQVLEREIGFLEEEVRSMEGLQPASKSCKEVVDFVTCNVDPLIPLAKKTRRSCCFWKWLCRLPCLNVSWMCCCCCSSNPDKPRCCGCSSSCLNSPCFNKCKCSCNCCEPHCPSCSTCSTIKCRCYPKCPKVNMCSCCNKTSCYPCCCFCY